MRTLLQLALILAFAAAIIWYTAVPLQRVGHCYLVTSDSVRHGSGHAYQEVSTDVRE